MTIIDTMDQLGIRYIIRPLGLLGRLQLINTFDDVGTVLVCRPLRYLHRFAAFLLDSELYPTFSYSDLASLKADTSLVSSMSSTRTSRRGGRSGGRTASRRVSERGRIRKSRGGSKRSRRSRISGELEGSKSTTSVMSVMSAEKKELMRINGRP